MHNLTKQQFIKLAKDYNVIPLFESLPADLDTPVSAFLKIKTGDYDFLFESVVGGEKWARYSFLGTRPKKVYSLTNNTFTVNHIESGNVKTKDFGDDPLSVIKKDFDLFCVYQDPKLPRFFGGVVGYLGYDMVCFFDGIKLHNKSQQDIPDMCFFETDVVVIFDNLYQIMNVVKTVFINDDIRQNESAVSDLYEDSIKQIEDTKQKLYQPTVPAFSNDEMIELTKSQSFNQNDYCDVVNKAKEYIKSGDIFQVVLSVKFELNSAKHNALEIYRALRRTNPSPYMYYLGFADLKIVGASPEVMVRLEDKKVEVRPIAGTRKRGLTEKEDLALEEELKKDPKELSEHIMLVDLGRNDIGRIAKTGTVTVNEKEVIERYSHVMHLVSHVKGELSEDKDVFDVIKATFPAGTLSGAPKIRAMQIIDELEPKSRGVYGGAVGYISFTKNTDLAIAIRTAVLTKDKLYIQAGAGIVHDSVPEKEYEECENKAKAVFGALVSK